MSTEAPAATTPDTATLYAGHDTDWHAYMEHPTQGPLAWCLGHGGDQVDLATGEYRCERFDPEKATAVLAGEGWSVIGGWRETPDGAEYPYVAEVRPVTGAGG